MSVRIDASAGEPVLVLPPRTSMRKGLEFVHSHRDWIVERLNALPNAQPFKPGAIIPFGGDPHILVHSGKLRDATRREGQSIITGGDPDQFSRRIEDFLRAQARARITEKASDYAVLLGRRPSRITIKDTKSRWGSCTPQRALSFSWRLVLAPEPVFDYLIAHECAHMRELNHGPNFWRLVEQLDPDYKRHRTWLDCHGMTLHAYGRRA